MLEIAKYHIDTPGTREHVCFTESGVCDLAMYMRQVESIANESYIYEIWDVQGGKSWFYACGLWAVK